MRAQPVDKKLCFCDVLHTGTVDRVTMVLSLEHKLPRAKLGAVFTPMG